MYKLIVQVKSIFGVQYSPFKALAFICVTRGGGQGGAPLKYELSCICIGFTLLKEFCARGCLPPWKRCPPSCEIFWLHPCFQQIFLVKRIPSCRIQKKLVMNIFSSLISCPFQNIDGCKGKMCVASDEDIFFIYIFHLV